MRWWPWARRPSPARPIPVTAREAAQMARTFQYAREWVCGCGARLAIRARADRPAGPSNFTPTHYGHATVAAGSLTWDGLAEERGWRTRPVQCPACQHGLTRAAYKDARRRGRL